MKIGVFTPLLSQLSLSMVLARLKQLDIETIELGTGNYPGDAHCKLSMLDDAQALAEFRRVLADGGLLLLAVHAGEEVRHSAEWFGAAVDVSFRFFDPGWLSAELDRAGFTVEALTRRQPYPGAEVATERAYFMARARPAQAPVK